MVLLCGGVLFRLIEYGLNSGRFVCVVELYSLLIEGVWKFLV